MPTEVLHLALAAALLATLGCSSGDSVEGGSGAGGSSASQGSVSSSAAAGETSGAGGLGCFSTEATCDGKCVDLETSAAHCGECGHACGATANSSSECIAGQCVDDCAAGFVQGGSGCTNFLGTSELYPTQCPGCSTPNALTGDCTCPAGTSALGLAVQSDCPAMALRAATTLELCVATGISDTADFGGAYQVDDIDGWCNAVAKCRAGNPLAAGACACPAGFEDTVTLRSIVRLCDASEGGTLVVLCGRKTPSVVSFGGAFQTDDLEPSCRVPNPWTGACSCPAGTVDHGHRVMVDGSAGLYGSNVHVCTP